MGLNDNIINKGRIPDRLSQFFKNLFEKTDEFKGNILKDLSNQERYNKVKEIMDKENIDEHSLEWAKMFIENWLAVYVISTIKDFPSDTHNDIIDLLIENDECVYLLWDDNNMVNDFDVDTEETYRKLYYTGRLHCLGKKASFRGFSVTPSSNNERRHWDVLDGLEKFKANSLIRKCIIKLYEWEKNDEYLKFVFSNGVLEKFKNLLTSEELDEHKELIDRLEKILSE